MKPSISKKTQDYLKQLEKTSSDKADFHYNQLDAVDRLIYEDGLRIKGLYIDKDLDLILVILNNRKIIKYPVSINKDLFKAPDNKLLNFENDGFGIHWPDLDIDLSLYGFLEFELSQIDKPIQ
jgi:hypothetical protein